MKRPTAEIKLINSANASRRDFWTLEREAILIDRAAAGLFASGIADAIGHGCTRNMVISKAKRLGVKLHGWAGFRRAATINEAKRKLAAELDREQHHMDYARQCAARADELRERIASMEADEKIRVSRGTQVAA